jgi:hypothetical protein
MQIKSKLLIFPGENCMRNVSKIPKGYYVKRTEALYKRDRKTPLKSRSSILYPNGKVVNYGDASGSFVSFLKNNLLSQG